MNGPLPRVPARVESPLRPPRDLRAVALACAFAGALLAARFAWTGGLGFAFLLWNLAHNPVEEDIERVGHFRMNQEVMPVGLELAEDRMHGPQLSEKCGVVGVHPSRVADLVEDMTQS